MVQKYASLGNVKASFTFGFLFNFEVMKNYALIILLLFLACSKEEFPEPPDVQDVIPTVPIEPTVTVQPGVPCEDGMAGIYPCKGYNLLSRISLDSFGSSEGNDNWGWTDPDTGKEYVLAGLDDGTSFVDISDPESPEILGKLPSATQNSPWRDIKVFQNYAFIVSEASNHGLQVFDLTRLRAVSSYQTFSTDARLTSIENAHNIWINEETGFAYVFGSNLYQGGPVFVDINEPKKPRVVGGYDADSYTHDAQIVIYNGPDEDYVGKEILFGSNSDGGSSNQIVIVDVTDKDNPVKINSITYSNGGYTHQGILTEDHRFFFLGDELDELNFGNATHTRIFDFTNLDEPQLFLNHFGGVNAIDHNGYITGNKFYLANYTAGLRVYDLSEIDNKRVAEFGYFDTFPEDNNPKFDGVWNVYPYFESGVIALQDISSGMFLIKASQ